MRGLAKLWLLFVLGGLLLMVAALAYAFAPIGQLYSEALHNPLGDARVEASAGPAGQEGKLLMAKVFARLPLALPGIALWVFGIVLRARAFAQRNRERAARAFREPAAKAAEKRGAM
jgi:hypothetical protein